MPVTVILNLRALSHGPATRSFHCLMHPVFLERIAKANPAMGEKLHSGGAMTPFSLSPVMGAKKRIVENHSYWVRICLLQDDLIEVFLDSLEKNLWSEPIHLENHVFIPENLVFGTQENNPWSKGETYQEMVEKSSGMEKISLAVTSPMSFKRGDLHYPLPEPAMIAGNLGRRWKLFSDAPLPQNFDCANVSFSFLDIKTMPFALRRGGTIVGITGRLSFISKGPLEERKHFETLTRFAFYAGIGVKTTQGMGMCRMR